MSSGDDAPRLGQSGRGLDLAFAGFFFGLTLFYLADSVADTDLWGHVRFGQDTLKAGWVLPQDPYSFLTGGSTWINHEWLAEVSFALAYDTAGAPGLIALKVALTALILGLMYRHMRRQGLTPLQAGILLMVVAIPLRLGLGTIRPHVYTYVGFLLILLLIHAAEHGRVWVLAAAPLLLAVWVNLHGGFLAGVGVLGLWVVFRAVGRFGRTDEPGGRRLASVSWLLVVLSASFAALLLNPYGSKLLVFLLRTATVPRPEITEWQPLKIMSVAGTITLLLLAVALAGFLGSKRPKEAGSIAVFAVTAVAPLIAARHLPLFEIAVVVLASEHIADAWKGNQNASLAWGRRGWLAVPLALAALVLLGLTLRSFRCIRLDPREFRLPARAVAILKASGVRGNLVIDYDWGEYAIWHLAPGLKVSLDGRRETVYDDAIYQEQLNFRDGVGDWSALIRRPEVSIVLVDRHRPVFNLMTLVRGWTFVYQDPLCGLFVRDSARTQIEQIIRVPMPGLPFDGNGLCFPAPETSSRSEVASEP